jgi:hypothetical protein
MGFRFLANKEDVDGIISLDANWCDRRNDGNCALDESANTCEAMKPHKADYQLSNEERALAV